MKSTCPEEVAAHLSWWAIFLHSFHCQLVCHLSFRRRPCRLRRRRSHVIVVRLYCCRHHRTVLHRRWSIRMITYRCLPHWLGNHLVLCYRLSFRGGRGFRLDRSVAAFWAFLYVRWLFATLLIILCFQHFGPMSMHQRVPLILHRILRSTGISFATVTNCFLVDSELDQNVQLLLCPSWFLEWIKWFNHLSLHCLPLRPGMLRCWTISLVPIYAPTLSTDCPRVRSTVLHRIIFDQFPTFRTLLHAPNFCHIFKHHTPIHRAYLVSTRTITSGAFWLQRRSCSVVFVDQSVSFIFKNF